MKSKPKSPAPASPLQSFPLDGMVSLLRYLDPGLAPGAALKIAVRLDKVARPPALYSDFAAAVVKAGFHRRYAVQLAGLTSAARQTNLTALAQPAPKTEPRSERVALWTTDQITHAAAISSLVEKNETIEDVIAVFDRGNPYERRVYVLSRSLDPKVPKTHRYKLRSLPSFRVDACEGSLAALRQYAQRDALLDLDAANHRNSSNRQTEKLILRLPETLSAEKE